MEDNRARPACYPESEDPDGHEGAATDFRGTERPAESEPAWKSQSERGDEIARMLSARSSQTDRLQDGGASKGIRKLPSLKSSYADEEQFERIAATQRDLNAKIERLVKLSESLGTQGPDAGVGVAFAIQLAPELRAGRIRLGWSPSPSIGRDNYHGPTARLVRIYPATEEQAKNLIDHLESELHPTALGSSSYDFESLESCLSVIDLFLGLGPVGEPEELEASQTEPEPDVPARHAYDAATKDRAADMIAGGKTLRSVAKALGVSERTLRRWKADSQADVSDKAATFGHEMESSTDSLES